MVVSDAVETLVTMATDAACWRIVHASPDSVDAVRPRTGAELYQALDCLLSLPPAPPGETAALVLDPHQPR